MKWIAFCGPEQMIVGIGITKDEAIRDAIYQIGDEAKEEDFDTVQCTNRMYDHISKYGAELGQFNWSITKGIAHLD